MTPIPPSSSSSSSEKSSSGESSSDSSSSARRWRLRARSASSGSLSLESSWHGNSDTALWRTSKQIPHFMYADTASFFFALPVPPRADPLGAGAGPLPPFASPPFDILSSSERSAGAGLLHPGKAHREEHFLEHIKCGIICLLVRVFASALDLNEDWRAHSELGASAIGRKRDWLSWTSTEFTWTWVEGGGSIDDTSSDGIDGRSCTIFESP